MKSIDAVIGRVLDAVHEFTERGESGKAHEFAQTYASLVYAKNAQEYGGTFGSKPPGVDSGMAIEQNGNA